MKKAVRYTLRILAWITGIIIAIWAAFMIYVNVNEAELLRTVSTAIRERTKGEVKIKGLSVGFFRTFPVLSLRLKEVLVRDSLFTTHKQDLLRAGDVYLRVSIPELVLGGKATLGQITIVNGSISVITDSSGRTNEYVFKSKSTGKRVASSVLPDIVLKNTLVTYGNPLRKKYYRGMVKTMRCVVSESGEIVKFNVNTDILVHGLAFNTRKGAFLRNANVGGRWKLSYSKQDKTLLLKDIRININGHPFYLNGKYNIDSARGNYDLTIKTSQANFNITAAYLADSLEKRVRKYSMTRPVNFEVRLLSLTINEPLPLVQVKAEVKNNAVSSPYGLFQNCSFTIMYHNEVQKGKRRYDDNSAIIIRDFKGEWEGLPLVSRSCTISNLTYPFLTCDLSSKIDLRALNKLTGSSTLRFEAGVAAVNILFKGPVSGRDSMASNINGQVAISKAALQYLPRRFVLTNCNGSLKFSNNDLTVPKLTATAGSTRLEMNGEAKNFLAMLNVSPEKLKMYWKVYSPHLNLNDFKSFLARPEARKAQNGKAQFSAASSRVDKMFSDGDVYITLETPVMEYKTFKATGVQASVILKPSEISLEKGFLKHANGSIDISGTLTNGINNNPVSLNTEMRNMDIPVLFKAFGNFGQDALTHDNLHGKISASIKFTTAITNKAELVTSSSNGSVAFLLENGELNNFAPLVDISEKVFKKQDFSHIRFADLKNKLDIKGSAFIIHPMEIRSSALNLFVEGIYDVKKGTDMSIRLPLRNLTKSQANTDLSDGRKAKKGLSVRLRAKTGSDGKLKISWDPFKFSVQNKEQVKDSTGANN